MNQEELDLELYKSIKMVVRNSQHDCDKYRKVFYMRFFSDPLDDTPFPIKMIREFDDISIGSIDTLNEIIKMVELHKDPIHISALNDMKLSIDDLSDIVRFMELSHYIMNKHKERRGIK